MPENTKIMVVEDEWIIANDIKITLTDMKYEVAALVTSGEEAIKKAEEIIPDLILMDVMLQGEMDGIDAAGRIRSRFDIPIIYITAYADDNLVEKAKLTNHFGYLLKPFKDRELQIAIEMALYKDRMEKEQKRLVTELQTAHDKIKKLHGFLPICASCKKIRDDKGYWHRVEEYIQDHSDVEFSHGICLDCAKKLNPELYDDIKK